MHLMTTYLHRNRGCCRFIAGSQSLRRCTTLYPTVAPVRQQYFSTSSTLLKKASNRDRDETSFDANSNISDKGPVGHEAYKARLRSGENIIRREHGGSMMPKIRSGEKIEYQPITEPGELSKGDIVWCKVGRNHYTHLIKAKSYDGSVWRYLIGNNQGGTNGWITSENIFAKAISAGGRSL